jgi:hypothetical protein
VKHTLALIATLALTLVIGASVGDAARPQTTAPGYNFKINVSIVKGGRVVLSSSSARRGWLAHFLIKNKDVKAHRIVIGGLPVKKPIAPGATAKLGSYLEDRGAFKIEVDGTFRGYFNVV